MTADEIKAKRDEDILLALLMQAAGKSLFEIALATGRTKEWLRSHGIA